MTKENKRRLLAFGVVIICAVIAMFPYITENHYFLFVDVGSDSFHQNYPYWVALARWIEEGFTNGGFLFTEGLGMANGSISFSLTNWFLWFGEEKVAYLLGIDYFFKLVLAGVFFYQFLAVKGLDFWYRLVLTFGYMFCGHMVERASWTSYPIEVVLVALWLLSFELWFVRKDWRWLPVATMFFFYYKQGAYALVLHGALMVAYVLLRYITERHVKGKYIGLAILAIALLLLVYLVVTKFAIINMIKAMLGTTRAQNQLADTEWSIKYFLPDLTILPVLFYQTIGCGILGNALNYAGEWNLLEDPAMYVGISAILLLPLAFYCMNGKQRTLYGVGLVGGFLYCVCDGLRLVANGFANETFKLSSFWISVLLLLTIANVNWEKLQESKGLVSIFLLFLSTIFLSGLLYIYRGYVPEGGRRELRLTFILLGAEAVTYAFLLIMRQRLLSKVLRWIVVLMAFSEVLLFSVPMLQERAFAEPAWYQDGTREALQVIEQQDEGFYRVNKQYQTQSMCDSLVQNYRGISCYVGGFGIGDDFYKWYYDLNLIAGSDMRLIYEPSNFDDVMSYLGVKYILAKKPILNYGYKKIDEVNEIGIYKNEYATPFGFVYHKSIDRADYEKLTYKQRQQVLLQALITDAEEPLLPKLSEEDMKRLETQKNLIKEYAVPFEYSVEDYKFHFPRLKEDEVLLLRVHFADTEGGYAQINVHTPEDDVYTINVIDLAGAGGQVYEVNQPGVDRVWVNSLAYLDDLEIACVPQDVYYQYYVEQVTRNQEEALNITECDYTYMKGNISVQEDGVLFLPIINNVWGVFIDGTATHLVKVNDAFVGCEISKGNHVVEFKCGAGQTKDKYVGVLKKVIISILIIVVGTIVIKKRRGESKR